MCNNRNQSLRGDGPPDPVDITPLLWLLAINTVSNAGTQYLMNGQKMPSVKSIGTFAVINGVYLFFIKKMVEDQLVKFIDNPELLSVASMSIGNTISSSGAVLIGLKSGKLNEKFVMDALKDSFATAVVAEGIIKFVLPMIQKETDNNN